MTTPFDPALHVLHRAQVGAQALLPSPPAGRTLVNVWRVLDAQGLREHGLVHGKTVFLEDQGHDWKVSRSGALRYSTRQAEPGQWLEVLLDYQTPLEARQSATAAPARFDPMTGQPLSASEPAMRPPYDPSLHVLFTIQTGLENPTELPEAPDGRQLRRIWTVIDTARLEELGPKHNVTGFMEEKGHDWQLDSEGKLRFYSRMVEKDSQVEVILDYETADEMNERLFGKRPSVRSRVAGPR